MGASSVPRFLHAVLGLDSSRRHGELIKKLLTATAPGGQAGKLGHHSAAQTVRQADAGRMHARFMDRQTGKRSFFRLHVVLRWTHAGPTGRNSRGPPYLRVVRWTCREAAREISPMQLECCSESKSSNAILNREISGHRKASLPGGPRASIPSG